MSNIKNSNIVEWCRHADLVAPGCDYLRLSFYDTIYEYEKILGKINCTNSSEYYDEDTGYHYSRIKFDIGEGLIIHKSYLDVPIRIGMYCRYSDHLKHITGFSAKFDIYGSGLRLMEIGGLPDTYIDDIVSSSCSSKNWLPQDPMITRYDYKLDLMYKTYKVFPTPERMFSKLRLDTPIQLNQEAQRTQKVQLYKMWLYRLSGWGVGSKSNKRYYIRMYDKKLDTNKKGKEVMYGDYDTYTSVYRYEVQFGSKFCMPFRYSEIDWLYQKIQSFMWWEYIFEWVMFYKYDEKKMRQSSKYRARQFSQFGWRGETIMNIGYNPYIVLFEELDVRDTKRNREEVWKYIDWLAEHKKTL